MGFKGQYNTKFGCSSHSGKRGLPEVCDILAVVVGLTLAGRQLPTQWFYYSLSSAGQRREKIMKGSCSSGFLPHPSSSL